MGEETGFKPTPFVPKCGICFVTFIATHLPLAPAGLEAGLEGCWQQEGGAEGGKSVLSAGRERDGINPREGGKGEME